MEKIEIRKIEDSTLSEKWFDASIPLNYSLTAIIGKKGSGKSALADTFGLLGDSKAETHFSFLNSEKFRSPKNNKASQFIASLDWADGRQAKKVLNENADITKPHSVLYLPQRYFEIICNELNEPGKGKFHRELKDVIFSHVSDAARFGMDNLDSIISFKTQEKAKEIALLKNELVSINESIVELERKITPEAIARLQSEVTRMENELAAHRNAKPQEKKKPGHEGIEAGQGVIETQVDAIANQLKELEQDISGASEQYKVIAEKAVRAENLLAKIDNFETVYREFKGAMESELKKIELEMRITDFAVDRQAIPAFLQKLQSEQSKLSAQLNHEHEGGFVHKQQLLKKQHENLKNKLDQPLKEYHDYLKAVEEWKSREGQLIGNSQEVGSLEYFRNKLKETEKAPEILKEMETRREALALRILSGKRELTTVYRDLYDPVEQYVRRSDVIGEERYQLHFSASLEFTGFEEGFLNLINQSRKGSFYGKAEGEKMLKGIIARSSVDTDRGLLGFLADMMDHIRHDKRQNTNETVKVLEQLRNQEGLVEFYNFLFSLDYLNPAYSLQWAGKALDQLSPGERGTLLLIFYLLIDKRDVPLIVDQPEENLDNETIYQVLIPCIKDAKKRRQILMVTHNPNLAVVCDAEQIICASFDKESGNRVSYVTGAIEDDQVNTAILNILEGTKPAFIARKMKYYIN